MVQDVEPVNAPGRNNSTMGKRLAAERERLKMSQTVLGAHGLVSKGTQINYEKGATPPPADYLERVSEVGIDVLYVVTGRYSWQMTQRMGHFLAAPEIQLLERYRQMTESGQKLADGVVHAIFVANPED